jgi:hypothetical protein
MSENDHLEHIRSFPSMATRYTVHPEHIRSFPSMATRYTVHPEHIKANCLHNWLFNRNVITDYLIASSGVAAF